MIALVTTLVVGTGGYMIFTYARPYLHGSGCEVKTTARRMPLDLEQAANSATVAAVAFRKELPERAVVIAYATAIQESHLHNLAGGDRDSVGMFQQRPSQGWGSPEQLRDPVTATSKFFDGLVKVKDYLDRDLHDAAQRVQRSADGRAYARHEDEGRLLAEAYTGRRFAAVRCWFTPRERTEPRHAEAIRELRRSFGGRLRPVGPVGSGSAGVRVPGSRTGWAVASWAVSHAQRYGLTRIRFAGRHWTADNGHDGWTEDPKAPGDRVVID